MKKGVLRLGIPPMVGRQIADLIRRFRQTYPGIELKISELGGLSVEQAVMSGELDLAMTVLPFDSEQPLTFLPLLGHPMCVVAPRTPQWLNRTSINIAELADSPILIYNEDFALYKMLMKAFRRAGFEPHIAVRSGQWDFLASMVQAGVGIAMLPEPVCRWLDKENGLATAGTAHGVENRADLAPGQLPVARRAGWIACCRDYWPPLK